MPDSENHDNPLILVVDDEWMNRELIEGILNVDDLRALLAHDAHDALEKIADQRPDALVVDIRMPDMDGLALTRHLKADPATADLPVVLVTGLMLDDAQRAQAREAGAVAIIGRTHLTNTLIPVLRDVLSQTND